MAMSDSYQDMSPLLSYTVVYTPSSGELQRTPDSQYSLLLWRKVECRKQTHIDPSWYVTKLEYSFAKRDAEDTGTSSTWKKEKVHIS